MFKSLAGWEATRDTLHKYSNIPSVIAQGNLEHHPKWWHISLKLVEDGLVTSEFTNAIGHPMIVKMDMLNHEIQLLHKNETVLRLDMTAGLSSTTLGDKLIASLINHKLDRTYQIKKFQSDAPRIYDVEIAERWFSNLKLIYQTFEQHKAALPCETSPIQLWPHHFDMSMEYFGTRTITQTENGETKEYPAQLNLGWSPGDATHPAPYFYSNPWPFENDSLLQCDLPHGARWTTDGFEGTLLPFENVVNDENGVEKVLAYARTVFEFSKDTLLV